MAFWMAPVGAAIGKVVGSVLEKATQWIPSRDQHNRTKIEKFRKERDEIIQAGIPDNRRVRLEYVLAELSRAETDLQAR